MALPIVGPRRCVVDPQCLEDLEWWTATKAGNATKVLKLMRACLREPFTGLGKPEPLIGLGANTWSRRVTQEHRLVYRVYDDRVVFLLARYHYE